jgi:TetR/AcrR family transcriptional repressor of nem operon
MSSSQPVGRPRQFDEEETIARAVDVFWRLGTKGATTRVLESELGMTQSSIYNAFGDKSELLDRVIGRYLERLDDEVVCAIDHPAAGFDELHAFIDDVVAWVTVPDKTGCLFLNTSGEFGTADPKLVAMAAGYRERLRSLFLKLFVAEGVHEAHHHANTFLAAVMGMNIAARSGASREEVESLAQALHHQLTLLG